MSDRSNSLNISEGNDLKGLLVRIGEAGSPADIGRCLEGSKFAVHLSIYSIGIFRLDDVPIKETIFSTEIVEAGLTVNDFADAIQWSLCKEAESLMRPFDLLSHSFVTVECSNFDPLRDRVKKLGLKQVMFIPLQIKNMLILTIVNFPDGDFDQQARRILPEIYQLVLAIFERFPGLTKWTDETLLSTREKEILELTANGLTEAVISDRLGISAHTVRNHIQSCKRKLDARSKSHAVAIAMRDREIVPEGAK